MRRQRLRPLTEAEAYARCHGTRDSEVRIVKIEPRQKRARARQKAQLRLLKTESDDFAASVQRDLERLPTIEEHDPSR